MAVHFVLEGSLLHQDSDEARRLRAKEGLSEGTKTHCSNIMCLYIFKLIVFHIVLLLHEVFAGVVHTCCHKVSLATCAIIFKIQVHFLHSQIMM